MTRVEASERLAACSGPQCSGNEAPLRDAKLFTGFNVWHRKDRLESGACAIRCRLDPSINACHLGISQSDWEPTARL